MFYKNVKYFYLFSNLIHYIWSLFWCAGMCLVLLLYIFVVEASLCLLLRLIVSLFFFLLCPVFFVVYYFPCFALEAHSEVDFLVLCSWSLEGIVCRGKMFWFIGKEKWKGRKWMGSSSGRQRKKSVILRLTLHIKFPTNFASDTM